MKKVIDIRILAAMAIGVLQAEPAQAVCTGAVTTSSYVVLYRDASSPYDYKIAKCDYDDSTWDVLDTCTQNASGQLTEDVEITGSSSSDLIEILSGTSPSLACNGNSLPTPHSWPSSGGSHSVSIDAGAGNDIVRSRTAEFSYQINVAVIFLGRGGSDCLSAGGGHQAHDYDVLLGGGGDDYIVDDHGTNDTFMGDDCTDVYPYICGPGGGDDCIRTPQTYTLLICGPGTDSSYPDYGTNGCESENQSCVCPFSWSPPW